MKQPTHQELEDLHNRLRNIVLNTCNKIGCGSCGLEWVENEKPVCSATELQGKILDLEMIKNQEVNNYEKQFKKGWIT